MSFNISNSTNYKIFNKVIGNFEILALSILFTSLLFLCVLSFTWSIYVLMCIFKEKKQRKLIIYLKNTINIHAWNIRMKNSQRKIVRDTFLFVISSFEWVTVFIILFYSFCRNWQKLLKPIEITPQSLDISNTLYSFLNNSTLTKIAVNCLLMMVLIIIVLIRVLTEYLSVEYDFFSNSPFNFRAKFKRAAAMLIYIFLLGMVRQTIIFQWVLIMVYSTYELVYFSNASKTLKELLYKRYFDAKTHEFQKLAITGYYKLAYLEFKIGSCLLKTSFSMHILNIGILFIFSFLSLVISSPNNFIQVIFFNEELRGFSPILANYQLIFTTVKKTYTIVQLLLLTVGWGLLLVPYCLVSLMACKHWLKVKIQMSKDYPNHDVIKKLIQYRNL